eukprot:PhM_4_TR13418/c0_g1_i1/m.58416
MMFDAKFSPSSSSESSFRVKSSSTSPASRRAPRHVDDADDESVVLLSRSCALALLSRSKSSAPPNLGCATSSRCTPKRSSSSEMFVRSRSSSSKVSSSLSSFSFVSFRLLLRRMERTFRWCSRLLLVVVFVVVCCSERICAVMSATLLSIRSRARSSAEVLMRASSSCWLLRMLFRIAWHSTGSEDVSHHFEEEPEDVVVVVVVVVPLSSECTTFSTRACTLRSRSKILSKSMSSSTEAWSRQDCSAGHTYGIELRGAFGAGVGNGGRPCGGGATDVAVDDADVMAAAASAMAAGLGGCEVDVDVATAVAGLASLCAGLVCEIVVDPSAVSPPAATAVLRVPSLSSSCAWGRSEARRSVGGDTW